MRSGRSQLSAVPVVVAAALLLPGCTPGTGVVPEASSGTTRAVGAPTSAGAPTSPDAPTSEGTSTTRELAAPSGTVPDGWEQHTTAEGRVGFALPAGAQQVSTPNPEAPDVLVDSFVVQDGDTVLSVLWQPWPDGQGAPREGTVELALQDFRDGFTSGSDLDPATVQQQRLQVQGRPGLEVTGRSGDRGTVVSARYLLLERGGLGLVVLGADQAAVDPATETLFETLGLP